MIGIGGCSRSGKSSLAYEIKEQLHDRKVVLLAMDNYVFPESQIPKIKDRIDWESPESVNFEQIMRTIEDCKYYDVIVIEGILIFADESLRKQFDTTVWMQISKETFLARRRNETRWGDEPDWFLEHVWESHLQYGQFPEADFVVSGEEEISLEVLNRLVKTLS
ncbi:hypothetical protein [Ekhidna sp.]|uniref:uridine kinase family protein n=1 Tax=Ekhidna sp. TaxID=2608089 RepID=UPI003297C996